MKLLESTNKVVDKHENSENVPKLESVEVVEFSSVEVWFTDQSGKPLDIENNVKSNRLTLVLLTSFL